MKVIIAGSRNIGFVDGVQSSDTTIVNEAVVQSGYEVTEVVHGCAKGVDTLGRLWAEEKNIPHTGDQFKPNWNTSAGYNSRAGFERNSEMVEYSDALIAIWDGNSRGTKDTIKKMERAGKPLFIWQNT